MSETPDSNTPSDARISQPLPTTHIGERHESDDELDPRIAKLVDYYYGQQVAGAAPSIDEFVELHSEFRAELRECLEGLQLAEAGQPTDPLTSNQMPKQLGDFRIVREVGRGGMGIVYEAQQIALKRRVALKILRYAVADQEAMLRFQREAETVAKLHHSNIVPIFAVGEEAGVHYFAMQFIDGQSLDQLQRDRQEPFDSDEVVEWGHQVAEALAYAHENEIIHRDVKPSNLIRDQHGRVWLTDFGLAKRLDDMRLSMTGAVLGTPRYMSPEQASSVSQPVDHRTDIYSLGATLYELLTGQPLFDVKSPHAALGHIVSTEPTPPRTIRPNIPRDVETIILRCLSKDAGDRYDTARELASDLLAITEGRPIQARRPSWVEQLGRWLQKNQRSVSIASSTAGLVAAVIFGTWFAANRYHESQLGRVQFNTNEVYSAPMIGELLNEDGSTAVSSFTVPTQQPIEITNGDFQFRVRVDGEPSNTSQFSVHPLANDLVQVELPSRDVWPHVEIDGPWQIVQSNGAANVLVYDRDGIVLLNGETSEELWRTELRKNETLVQQMKRANLTWDWKVHQYPDQFGSEQFTPAKATAANADWNGDGHPDLLLTMHEAPLLMAISGKDGELLWSTEVAAETEYEAISRTLGEPLLVDVDEDGVLDIVTHHIDVENSQFKDRASYIVATKGTSGESLWRYDFDTDQLGTTKEHPLAPRSVCWRGRTRRNELETWNEADRSQMKTRWGGRYIFGSSRFIIPHQPILVQHDDRNEIAIAAGNKLLRLNVNTGEPISSQPLGLIPICVPQTIDIDGDGQLELLACEQLTGRVINGAFEKGYYFRTTCWKLSDTQQEDKLIWEHTVAADWNWLLPFSDSQQTWPLLEDMDGDGVLEIIMPGESTIETTGYQVTPGGSLQVLNAKNGQPKWPNADKLIHADGQLNHFVTTPDFDADGVRDVATVTLSQGQSTGTVGGEPPTSYLHVDVLSGADGKRLTWIRSSPVTRPREDLPLVKNVSLLDDLLVVELQTDPKESPTGHLCIFSLSKGKEILTSHRVEQCRLADIDGDEHLDLLCWTPRRQFPPGGGRLKAWSLIDLSGSAGSSWSLTDQRLSPMGDIDGDGVDDVIGGTDMNFDRGKRFITAISGQTGKNVWRKPIDAPHAYRLSPLPVDANNDGVLDLLVGQSQVGHQIHSPLELWSGRTGQPLWRMKLDQPGAWSTERIFAEDLDNDGQDELLVLAQTAYGFDPSTSRNKPTQQPISLFCVNAGDGSVRWQTSVLKGRYLGQASYLQDGFKLISADVNADNVRDVIGFSVDDQLDDQHGLALQAWNGVDGEPLWRQGAGELPDNISVLEHEKYPSFVALQGNNLCQIVSLSDSNYAAPKTRFDVIGMDASTGLQAWTWSIKADDCSEPTKPSLTKRIPHGVTTISKFRSADGERVGFWYKALDEERVDFVLLDVTANFATPVLTQTLSSKPDAVDPENWQSDYVRKLFIAPVDLDHDGVDELIYTTPTSLIAYSIANQQIMWEHSFEFPNARIASISKPGEPIAITLILGKTRYKHDRVVAINGDGKKIWTTRTKAPVNVDEMYVLRSNKPDTPPTVMLTNGKRTYGTSARIENSTSEWTLPNANASRLDHRNVRSLPHGPERLVEQLAHSLLLSCVLIGLPFFYIGRLLKGRWSLRFLMFAPLVTGIVIAVSQFPPLEPQSMFTTPQFNFMVALNGLPLLVLLCVTFDAVRQGSWRRLACLAIAVIGGGTIAYLFMMYVEGVFETANGSDLANEVRYVWSWHIVATILAAGMGFVGMLLAMVRFVCFVARVRRRRGAAAV